MNKIIFFYYSLFYYYNYQYYPEYVKNLENIKIKITKKIYKFSGLC